MIIDCIADLYGFYPKLEGGDLLIVAGNLTACDTIGEHFDFHEWLNHQNYNKIVLISGNHDCVNQLRGKLPSNSTCEYLCDSGTEFEGLKIWGTPWSLTFDDINPKCTAFTGTEEDLEEKFALIPNDIDILITHDPPYLHFDNIPLKDGFFYCGHQYFLNKFRGSKLKLHIFGHIHGQPGKLKHSGTVQYINASYVNERYEPVNKPVRVIL